MVICHEDGCRGYPDLAAGYARPQYVGLPLVVRRKIRIGKGMGSIQLSGPCTPGSTLQTAGENAIVVNHELHWSSSVMSGYNWKKQTNPNHISGLLAFTY